MRAFATAAVLIMAALPAAPSFAQGLPPGLPPIDESKIMHGGGAYGGPSMNAGADIDQTVATLKTAAAALPTNQAQQVAFMLSNISSELHFRIARQNGILTQSDRADIAQRIQFLLTKNPLLTAATSTQ